MLRVVCLSLAVLGGLLTLGLAPAPAPASPAATPADDAIFTIDAVHSNLIYRLRHFGVSNFWGRVNGPTGTFLIDDANLGGSSISIVAEIKNMDAGNDGRDRFLQSPDFFNVREFPTAEFQSSSITKKGEGLYEATGTFTMHGVTKPLTVTIEDYTTAQTTRFGFRGGFECTFTVNRSEYGMSLFVEEGTLGDAVTITAAIEGVRLPS
ncbi:MAG: YceI family protein [Phycisphaerales bacterium]|nr:YceI family protein [Phycisphaerales bacterium]NNM27389.1 YceI family protein [Phycisphaerales bacterium]